MIVVGDARNSGAVSRLFGVEDDVEEQEAGGGEDDVVAEEHFDPEGGVAVAGQDVARGLDHGEQSGNEDGKEDEREKEFAVAAADGERGEEDSVDDQSPGAEWKNEGQLPGVAGDVKVVEDEEEGREDDLDDGDEEEVGDGFGEVELGARRRDHALRIHDLVADFAGPGLIEGGDGSEHGGHAEDAAGDLLRECAAGIEGDGEEHDDEAGKENHGDHGVEGAPLDAEIFGEMREEGAGHWWPSGEKFTGRATAHFAGVRWGRSSPKNNHRSFDSGRQGDLRSG
jgi:hypothetical protein